MRCRIIKLICLLVACLAFVVYFPVEVLASDPGLDISGSGAAPWNISNIAPGDSGLKTVTLHNSSGYTCSLHIWISNIVNTEGLNPESESGDTAEPGELGDYLLFKISPPSMALSTNIAMPALINNLPHSATDVYYIKIDPFETGQTVVLNWEWELPPETGNMVQGDSISFDINYLLEESTTTTTQDNWGWEPTTILRPPTTPTTPIQPPTITATPPPATITTMPPTTPITLLTVPPSDTRLTDIILGLIISVLFLLLLMQLRRRNKNKQTS